MLDVVAHSRPNFLPHNNDKWGSLGTHTHIAVLSNIHRRALIGWWRGVRVPILRCPLSLVHRWLFTHRNGNMIFPTACHNSPPPPNSLWLIRLCMKRKKKKKKKKRRTTGPVKVFSSLNQRQSEITFKQRAGIQHKLDPSFVPRWRKKKKTTTVSLRAELCQLKHFTSYTLGVVRFRGARLGAGQRNTFS